MSGSSSYSDCPCVANPRHLLCHTARDGAKTAEQWAQLSATVSKLLPPEAWQAFSVDLYLSFWTLSLQDIHCPTDSCGPHLVLAYLHVYCGLHPMLMDQHYAGACVTRGTLCYPESQLKLTLISSRAAIHAPT